MSDCKALALSVFAPQVCARVSCLRLLFWKQKSGEAAAAEEWSSNHELSGGVERVIGYNWE